MTRTVPLDLLVRAKDAAKRIGKQVWRGDGGPHIFVGLLLAELTAQIEQQREGQGDYVLVPREATPEMIAAAKGPLGQVNDILAQHQIRYGEIDLRVDGQYPLWHTYKAMLAAAPPAAPQDDGYKEAWYEIAYLLGIGAQNASPKDVHANQMMPRLRALRELEAATPQDSVPAWSWRQAFDEWKFDMNIPIAKGADWIESRALALAQTKG